MGKFKKHIKQLAYYHRNIVLPPKCYQMLPFGNVPWMRLPTGTAVEPMLPNGNGSYVTIMGTAVEPMLPNGNGSHVTKWYH